MAPLVYLDFESLQSPPVDLAGIVDSNGSLNLPTLSQWNSEHCNLLQLVADLDNLRSDYFAIPTPLSNPSSPPIPSKEISVTPEIPELPSKPPKPPIKEPASLPANVDRLASEINNVSITGQSPALPPRPNFSLPSTPQPLSNIPTGGASVSSNDISLSRTSPCVPAADSKLANAVSVSQQFQQPDLMDLGTETSEDPVHVKKIQELQNTLNKMAHSDQDTIQESLGSRVLSIKVAADQFETIYRHESASLDNLEQQIEEGKKLLTKEVEETDKELKRAREYIQNYGPPVDMSTILTTDREGLNQLYSLLAKDHAITDTIHTLNKMLGTDDVDFDVFLKKVRSLAREQFLTRFHINKILSTVNK